MMSQSISVVMAVYNGHKFLAEQVESVLSQLEPGDELVIIDDASTDDSIALLAEIDSPVLRIFRNDSNLGILQTFQRGLGLARHEIIFLCDQDDVWLPGKRAAYVAEFARNFAVCVVVSDAELIDGEGRLTAKSYMTTIRHGFDGSVLGTFWRNRYLGCAMAVRRSLLHVALPFPSYVPMHDMWLGILGRLFGQVVYLPEPYIRYRRHGSNASPSGAPWYRMIRWRAVLLVALLRRLGKIKFGLCKSARRPSLFEE